MSQPLNPLLFRLLERRFGEGSIRIVAQGEASLWHRRVIRTGSAQGKRKIERTEVEHSGEEYRVNCPFCNDTRQRLFFSHQWAILNERGWPELWPVRCFNEECVAGERGRSRRERLFEQVFKNPAEVRRAKLRPGRKIDPKELREVRPPGRIVYLDELAEREPTHRALEYLRNRLFDPLQLARDYQVAYCPDSEGFRLARHRIIAPVIFDGKEVGWQARYVGETEWRQDLPKYFTCPGMRKSLLLYNYDVAKYYQTLVLVEGVMDVWGFGPQAVGLFGKTISMIMRERLLSLARLHQVSLAILLDPDQDHAARARGEKHHIEALYEQLIKTGFERNQVARVYLPSGSDPGSSDADFLRAVVRSQARAQGVPVDFSLRSST